MGYNKPNRSSFYIVILCMFFISVFLLIYAEGRSVFNEYEFDEMDSALSGFIAVEISGVFPRDLLSPGKAIANELNIPYIPELEALLPSDDYSLITLSTSDDWTSLPNDITILDLELPDDDLMLLEKTNLWEEYVVQQKETLSDIVLKFSNITVNDIVQANELKDPNQLREKQILLIPLQENYINDTLEEVRTRKARIAASKEAVVPLEVKNYTVQDGDSLWSIANSMNVEVDTLIGCNTLGSVLRPNVVLRIPNQDGIFYKIKSGDTIDKISVTYKVQVDRIKKVNPDLDVGSLISGAELFIPGARIEAADSKDTKQKKDNKSNNKTSKKDSKSKNKEIVEGGSFRWPVVGRITSPYGWRRHPILRRADFHSAIDIKASKGTPIRASRGGKVLYSGWMSGYGKVVVIGHSNGYSTLYGHCSTLAVSKGQNVSINEVIARVGATGRATGPHLHFELRKGNSPVNPLKYLR